MSNGKTDTTGNLAVWTPGEPPPDEVRARLHANQEQYFGPGDIVPGAVAGFSTRPWTAEQARTGEGLNAETGFWHYAMSADERAAMTENYRQVYLGEPVPLTRWQSLVRWVSNLWKDRTDA
jgi:hypothetical protein